MPPWFTRLPNPARTLEDLPPGATITLRGTWRKADNWEAPTEGNTHHELQLIINPEGAGLVRLLGDDVWLPCDESLTYVVATGQPGGEYTIAWAEAQHGWGPLAYDILMEQVTALGGKLGPGDPSEDAKRVWQHYATRPDVEKIPRRLATLYPEEGFDYRKAPQLLLELSRLPRVAYQGDWEPYVATRSNPVHRALPLEEVLRWRPEAARRGVSEVARAPGGFVPAYQAAGGHLDRMTPWWRARREAFLARHLAQVAAHHEPLFDRKGRPTRRHLALVMWAYSPEPARLRT